MKYSEAIDLLENGKADKSIKYFQDNNNLLEYGYSLLMLGKIEEAKKIFLQSDSHRANWALKMISVANNEFYDYPTYFQIRNFLEIDISMLLKNKQLDFVQNLINYAQFFYGLNNESYKFFARALLKNGFTEGCKYFLDKSQDSNYNDTELQYMFVEYYLYINDIENAKKSIKKCLSVNPEYYPAIKTKEYLEKCHT